MELTQLETRSATGGVEVRVRTVYESPAQAVLCSVPVESLQRLIDLILKWGISTEHGEASNIKGSVTGGFVLDTDAYFEIVVNVEPED